LFSDVESLHYLLEETFLYNGFIKSEITINDKNMTYYEKGQGDITCIFSCGWAVPFPFADMFELADIISTQHRCIILDRFGYGFSDCNDGKRNFNNITQETKMLCDRLNIQKNIIFVGHSISTFHAIDLAKSFPEIIKGLVLIDSYIFVSKIGRFSFNINWIVAYFCLLLKKLGILSKMNDSKLKRILFGHRLIPEDVAVDALLITRERLYNKTVRNELKCAINDFKLLYKNLDKLKSVPVIAICRDATFGNNRKLLNYIQNTTIINLGKSSHFIHHIYPIKVAEQISELCI